MVVEFSKKSLNRLDHVESICSSLTAHEQLLVKGLLKEMELLEAKDRLTEKEIERFFQAIGLLLSKRSAGFRQAEQAYIREKGEDGEWRDERDEGKESLFVSMQTIRDRVHEFGGAKLLKSYHIPSAISRKTNVLLETAKAVTVALKAKPTTFKDRFGVEVTTKQMLQSLEADVKRVEKVIASLGVDVRETQAAMLVRDEAGDALYRSYGGGGSIVAGSFELIGEDGHAARLYPSPRRRRGEDPVEPADTETPTTDIPSEPSGE